MEPKVNPEADEKCVLSKMKISTIISVAVVTIPTGLGVIALHCSTEAFIIGLVAVSIGTLAILDLLMSTIRYHADEHEMRRQIALRAANRIAAENK